MHAGPADHPAPGESEQAHLEEAHHELCTALTCVRSNVELVRVELRRPGWPTRNGAIHIAAHLGEVETAVERLERLATDLRARHARIKKAPR